MCIILLNTEPGGAFHCPLCHYYMTTFNEILDGFRERCNKAAGVLEVWYV